MTDSIDSKGFRDYIFSIVTELATCELNSEEWTKNYCKIIEEFEEREKIIKILNDYSNKHVGCFPYRQYSK